MELFQRERLAFQSAKLGRCAPQQGCPAQLRCVLTYGRIRVHIDSPRDGPSSDKVGEKAVAWVGKSGLTIQSARDEGSTERIK